MKRKAFKREKKRCSRMIDQWLGPLAIAWWDIEVRYCQTSKQFRKATKVKSRNAAMNVVADWRYLTATIYVNTPLIVPFTDNEVARMWVHEFYHVVVNELRANDSDRSHEERVVSTLTASAFWIKAAAERGELKL